MRHKTRKTILSTFAISAAVSILGVAQIAAGSGEQDSQAALDSAPLVRHIIAPQATDPEIDTFLDPHFVWLDPAQQSDPTLWVFLPPTRGKPQGFQLIAMEAARLGYHVISLMYPNGDAIGAICNPIADPEERENCYENIRLQSIDGVVRSNLTKVNPPNSIYNRLTKLLQYLAVTFPEEGWEEFLEDGAPQWSLIAIAGHSQGGGNAAMIGKLNRVARVVMISSPTDGLLNADQAARWVAIDATPAERYFGLGHQREFPIRPIRANWKALGLDVFGAPVAPETSAPPYGCTHMLLTDLLPATGSYDQAHGSTAGDAFTPRLADGTPALRDAWRYISANSDDDSCEERETENEDTSATK